MLEVLDSSQQGGGLGPNQALVHYLMAIDGRGKLVNTVDDKCKTYVSEVHKHEVHKHEVRKHRGSCHKVVAMVKKMPAGVVVALFVIAGSQTVVDSLSLD